jgi:hypothetical protein
LGYNENDMGDLSDNFSHKDFACHCPECRGEYRIHLGLVGILEGIGAHFRRRPKILSGFYCGAYTEKLNRDKKTYHSSGKAVNIALENVPTAELFNYVQTIEGINGLGFYPEEKMVHIDTRPIEKKDAWIKERGKYAPLTDDKRAQYGLNKLQAPDLPAGRQDHKPQKAEEPQPPTS